MFSNLTIAGQYRLTAVPEKSVMIIILNSEADVLESKIQCNEILQENHMKAAITSNILLLSKRSNSPVWERAKMKISLI